MRARSEKQLGMRDGAPLLTEQDERTTTPGLFSLARLCGMASSLLRTSSGSALNRNNAIAQGLGLDIKEAIQGCRDMNMLDDLNAARQLVDVLRFNISRNVHFEEDLVTFHRPLPVPAPTKPAFFCVAAGQCNGDLQG